MPKKQSISICLYIVMVLALLTTACARQPLDNIIIAAPYSEGFMAIVARSNSSKATLFRFEGNRVRKVSQANGANAIAVTPDGANYVLVRSDKCVISTGEALPDRAVISTADGTKEVVLPQHYSSVKTYISPNGRYALIQGSPDPRDTMSVTTILIDSGGNLLWSRELYGHIVALGDDGRTVVIWQKEVRKLLDLLRGAEGSIIPELMVDNVVCSIDPAGNVDEMFIVEGGYVLFAGLDKRHYELVVGFQYNAEQKGFVAKYSMNTQRRTYELEFDKLLDGAVLDGGRFVTVSYMPPPSGRPGEVLVNGRAPDGSPLWSFKQQTVFGQFDLDPPLVGVHLTASPNGKRIALLAQGGTSPGSEKISVYDHEGKLMNEAILGKVKSTHKWVADNGSVIAGGRYFPGR